MDGIGSSRFSLNTEENNRAIEEERKQDEKFHYMISSCGSLSKYESRSKRTLIPQILASALAASFHIVFGISLSYSAILLPQLEQNNATSNESSGEFSITKSEGSWIASIIVLAVPAGAPIGGVLMDTIGRLNTVKLATVPGVIGWTLIALSNNLPMLLIGRVLTGFAAALGTGPAIVYITEIARADMRGSLISFAPAYTSFGMVLAYIKGWLAHWRTVAWMCNVYSIVPLILLFLVPESPAWLVSKGRCKEALKSLQWINKYQPQPNNQQSYSDLQLQVILKEQRKKEDAAAFHGSGVVGKLKEFLKPTAYKPLFILVGLFIFQQFSGIYITLFYSITFFDAVGSGINSYLSSILIGIVRAVMSVVNTYMLRTFRRRPLILYSAACMAVCMLVSGLFTMWIKEGTTTLNWIPVAAILFYVVSSMVGLLSIPWTMTAELFPIEIRGVAHSLVYSLANLIMFLSVQSYHTLNDWFNGIAGVQWFFAVVSLGGMVYSFVFLPETHGLKLVEIQDYFLTNTVFIGKSKKKRAAEIVMTKRTPADIVKNSNDQNQNLLSNKA